MVSLVFIAFFRAARTFLGEGYLEGKNFEPGEKVFAFSLVLICLAGLALRLFFAQGDLRFEMDINIFKSWTVRARRGLYGFYDRRGCDYPPGYIYVLRALGFVKEALGGAGEDLFTFLIKIPPIISDMAATVFIASVTKRKKGGRQALFFAAAYAFCPAVVFNSRVWGQADSVWLFFMALALWLLCRDRITGAALSYAAAVLIKPHRLMFGFVFLFVMLEKKDLKGTLKALGVGIIRIMAAAFPFTRSLDPVWIVKLYKSTMGSYKFFTVNGYNLYTLLGLNWKSLSDFSLSRIINPVVITVCGALGGAGFFASRRPEKPWSLALMNITAIFSFCTMMHERYLFPAVLISLMCRILSQGNTAKVFTGLFSAFSCLVFLNLMGVMCINGYLDFKVSPVFEKQIARGVLTATLFCLAFFLFASFEAPEEKSCPDTSDPRSDF